MDREAPLQALGSGLVDALGGQADGQPFQHGARLEDLDRFAIADLPHPCPAVRFANDEPFLLESDQRVLMAPLDISKDEADVRLDEMGVGGDLTTNDRATELLVIRVAAGRRQRRRIRSCGAGPPADGSFPAKSSVRSPK